MGDCSISTGKYRPIGDWDVSRVADMGWMFYAGRGSGNIFNQDISKWDVSRVTNMACMFKNAESFRSDISKWDVSKVINMAEIFCDAKLFNGEISKWDVSRVTNVRAMFSGAESFNADVFKWDMSRVKKKGPMFMRTIFDYVNSFKLDVSQRITACITGANMLKKEPSICVVSRVTDMGWMFHDAKAFNMDISKWDVSRVTNMQAMFSSAKSFNIDITKWDVSKVTDMGYMFNGAKSFNQTLCGEAWVSSKATRTAMFDGSLGSICGLCSIHIIFILLTINLPGLLIPSINLLLALRLPPQLSLFPPNLVIGLTPLTLSVTLFPACLYSNQ